VQNTSTCDVLIVGAGPAGTAAARALSRSGLRVVLVDRRTFPRDKVCGDCLISDTRNALDDLGIRERILLGATHATELRVHAPNGRFVPLHGAFSCLPRARFDALLLDAAQESGASFLGGSTLVSPLTTDGRIVGARFETGRGPFELRAPFTLLATGANAAVLDICGLGVSLESTAVAGRAYFQAPPDIAARFTHLTIAYDRDWCPGYGWIFPGPAGQFNIGVGLFPADRRRHGLKAFWHHFISRFQPAAALVRVSKQITEFRGAPMRTGLVRSRFGRPGLLVIGEAAAVTYPATGEGIGKAMESGLLAASIVHDALAQPRASDSVAERYGAEFRRRFLTRYRAYRVAQTWTGRPLMLNFLAERANAGAFVRRELESLIDERGDARELFSARGLLTALVR
jgi:menaquinone-9 beta-reductase